MNFGVGTDTQTCTQTNRKTDGKIITISWPGLGAGLSENNKQFTFGEEGGKGVGGREAEGE